MYMKKIIKKALSAALAVCVAVGCVVTAFAETDDKIASGVCGESLTWELTDDGTLTISGTGDMTSAPWGELKDQIKTVVMNDGLTSIASYAFYELRNVVGDIVIPDTVETIGSYSFAFYGYGSYTNRKGTLTIGSSVRTIGDHAFYRASLVGNVIIPDSVTNIGEYAFCWYGEMTTQNYSELRGMLKLSSNLERIEPNAFFNANFDGDLEIPDGVTVIGDNAFCNCGFNGRLTLPDSLTEIGERAFSWCTGLIGDLRIPATVSEIGNDAFRECRSFDGRLILENPGSEVGQCAFHRCGQDVIDFFADHPEYITCVDSVNEYGMPLTYVYCADCFNGSTGDTDAWTATYMHDPNEINVTVGETFTVNGAPADSFVYRSTDENVVKIINGEPVAAARGTAVVSAVSEDVPHTAYSANVRVSSIQPETYWIENIPYLHPGDQHQIGVHVVPEESEYVIRYDVEDENVAAIGEDGMISARGVGLASFTVSIEYETGSFSSSLLIQVVEPVTGISVDCGDVIRVPVGTSATYAFAVEPNDAFNKEIRLSPVSFDGQNAGAIRAYRDGNRIAFVADESGTAVIRIASADNPDVYRDITVIAVNEIGDINLTISVLVDVELGTKPTEESGAMIFTKDGAILSFDENPLIAENEYVVSIGDESLIFRLSDADHVTVNGLELSGPVFVCEDFLYLGYCDGRLLLTYEGFTAEEEESFPCELSAILGSPIKMTVGDVLPFQLNFEPETAATTEYRLTADDPSIVSAGVDSISAISAGNTVLTITAENKDGSVFSKTYAVTVLGDNDGDPVDNSDDPAEDENKSDNVTIFIPSNISIGDPEKIIVETDGDMQYTVEYDSSDDGVLSVDGNGNIVGLKDGTAELTVTVRFSNGDVVSKTVSVRVAEPAADHHDGFRCKRCDWYDRNKDHPVPLVRCIFWMIHTITHFVQQINAMT